ncbi:MAG TPA: hypothetical protein VFG33_12400 [Kribbella sp.]|uniref:hypothetical protein n=1 Tax=Kribbella sp. TaxID=1871183 RepID=UPI002D77CF3A|nr:hypothetical protein [Kribbella sp.]HET6294176.1 hypothetical protein [Kribbella sp.]
MGLEFRAVRFHVETASGRAGYAARFGSGMTVVRGGNTIGKSLLLQGLLYGAGLESLFATRKGVLTRAMTLQIDLDDVSVDVESSWVEVVVANGAGDVLTLQRVVKPRSGKVAATDLVRTWAGDVVDLEDRTPSVDYLVGRPGVATEERGFYRFFAEFLGWRQPQVPTYSGRTVPLYVQVVFGLGYVDQKRGWGGTVPQVPTTYQIVEPLRKAVEFALQLDVLIEAQRRQTLLEQQRQLANREERLRGSLEGLARLQGARIRFPDLPRVSTVAVGGKGSGTVVLSPAAEVLVEDVWLDLSERIDQLHQVRVNRGIRAVVETEERPETAALEVELADAERALAQISGRLEALNQDEHLLHTQLGALGRRMNALDDEYDRYRQLDALQQLGSVIAPLTMDNGDCPTCHQSLEAVESIEGNALPVAETRAAIREDRETVKNLVVEAEQRVELVAVRRAAWSQETSAARLRVRALKADLVAVDGTPSSSAIQLAVEQEQELARLLNLQAQFLDDADSWTLIAMDLAAVQAELSALGSTQETAEDKQRKGAWVARLREQLVEFGFESAVPAQVEIDSTMKPVVDSYDIGFQGSASDGIRLRWAYLLSLMETCAEVGGSHPGVLLMDEPGQQGVEQDSLAALYRHLLATSRTSGQVFVTTSEPPATLESWLGTDGYDLIDLGADRLLR